MAQPRKFVPNTALARITGKFKVGDRVRTQRYHGGPWNALAHVIELRTYDYVIRYDEGGDANNAFDFGTVGRSEANLEAAG